MRYSTHELTPAERFKLLVNTITWRPLAGVPPQDSAGRRDAAPYGFFNTLGGTPPLVAIGLVRAIARNAR